MFAWVTFVLISPGVMCRLGHVRLYASVDTNPATNRPPAKTIILMESPSQRQRFVPYTTAKRISISLLGEFAAAASGAAAHARRALRPAMRPRHNSVAELPQIRFFLVQ